MKKIIRITTISRTLAGQLNGQLKFLNSEFDILAVASGAEDLDIVHEREGVDVYEVDMYREIKPISDLISLLRLIKLFVKIKPNTVHANTPKASLLAMMAAKIARVPNRLYTVTGLRFETTSGYFRKLLVMMEKITCYCATKVIPEGKGVRDTLIKEKITTKPLQVIHHGNINGIDISYFSTSSISESKRDLRERYNIDFNSFTFVFIGRLVKDKGISELIEAFIGLYKINPCITLLLAGSYEENLDPLSSETLKIINSHKAIKYVGYQNDVRPFFKVADALVFPSYREGFPNVVMQAGAMGLPSIVSDISGCNEIIIDDENGVIIPPKDSDALLTQMKKFSESPDIVCRMSRNAPELIRTRYEQSDVWQAILEMYQSLEN